MSKPSDRCLQNILVEVKWALGKAYRKPVMMDFVATIIEASLSATLIAAELYFPLANITNINMIRKSIMVPLDIYRCRLRS